MWSVRIGERRWTGARCVVLLGTLLGLASVSNCGTVQQALQDLSAQHPTARLTDVRMANIGLESLELVFAVTVENPYTFDLPLLDVDYTLAAHQRPFLSGSTAVDGKVSARNALTVELPVRVDLLSLMNTITSTRPGQVVPYSAELGLRADVPGAEPIRFGLRTNGELPVPKPPTVRIASIRWSEASLDKVQGELRLDIENNNEFPFTVSQTRWDLSLIDVQVASGLNRQSLSLEPAQVGTLPIAVSFSPLKLGTGLVEVLVDLNRESVDYAISGVLSLDTSFGLMELPYLQSGTTRSEPAP